MGVYKKILLNNSVISAPVCFWIFLSVLFSYKETAPGINIWIILTALVTIITSFMVYRRYSTVLPPGIHRITALVIFITFFAFIFIQINNRTAGLMDRSQLPPQIRGFVASVDKVETRRYSCDIYFTTEYKSGARASGILVYNGECPPPAGSLIAVHSSAVLIPPCDNSYLSGLARQGISYRCIVDDSDITVINEGTPSWRTAVKEKIVGKINSIFPQNTAGLIIAVYFGDTTHLPKKILLNFRDAGVLHVLAASGMNIALVASFPLLLIPLGVGRRKALIISLLCAAAYLFITDMPVSLVRAAAMYLFVIINLVIYREKNSFNALYLAGILMILLQPWEIFNPGFQLSFGATAGILLFYRRYRESLKIFPGIIAGSLAVTFSAQIFAYPIIYLHMSQFNTAGFLTNLVIIPLVSAVAVLSIAALGISFLSPAAALFSGKGISILGSLIFSINEFASSLKFNFYTDNLYIVAAAMLLLSIPLLDIKILNRFKCAPVFAALLISTLLLKNIQNKTDLSSYTNYNNNDINLSRENGSLRLKLNFKQTGYFDDRVLTLLRKKNPDIKIIEISGTSYQNNTAFRILLNDFVIEECVINNVTSIDRNFKNFVRMLQKENIKVTFIFSS